MTVKDSKRQKAAIIGAGISGLSMGCYLQMNGFDTEIFEQSSRGGGLCTTWKKGEYTFDGCLHWLLGSNQGNPFYKLWSELIDLETVTFVNHDVRVYVEVKNSKDRHGNSVFSLYTDLARLEQYMIDLSPADKGVITGLIRSMRKIQGFEIPPVIQTIPTQFTLKQKIGMIKHLPLLWFMLRNKGLTNYQFAARLSSPFLKEAFELLYDGQEIPMLILTIPLAFADKGSTGYPVGGSYLFARKIEEKYISLGGKIHYNSEVAEIITEENAAKGVILSNGASFRSDLTISCADWYFTAFKALAGKYMNKKMLDLKEGRSLKVYYSVVSIHLGISRTFEDQPHFSRFPLKEDMILPDGTRCSRFELHLYNYDRTLAPEGKTSVSVSFYTMNGNWWIDLSCSDHTAYEKVKAELAKVVIRILEERIGNIANSVEEVSVATPATFFRYTNNWHGSTQGWLPGKNFMASSPIKYTFPGLENFFYASHWSLPGGGLPVAIKTARDVAQVICRKYHKKFTGQANE